MADEPKFRTDKVLRLDADGNIIVGDGINIGLRIKNLTLTERLQLLPFLVNELQKETTQEFLIAQLTKLLNLLVEGTRVERPAPKPPPIWIKGKIASQQISDVATGGKREGALIVELADLVKMGKVGLVVRIQNMEHDEKLSLLKLLARNLRAEKRKHG